ncbi:MAG: zinc-ribbon domain-containing protein [Clostridiaceae bacterium]|nr:zinc-ribbon domain-containing protein [Clostridiaceae bacterium]
MEHKFCKNCGAKLNPDVKFCASCGTEVSVSSGQAATMTAPRVTGSHSVSALKRKTKPMKILIPVIAIVLVLVAGICVLQRFFSSGENSFEKGATSETRIKANKDATVGSLKETGWQLQIPANTFKEDSKLNMRVLSVAESAEYQSADFELYGTPVEIKLENRKNVRLGGAVPITVQIPDDLLKDLAAEELFFAVYYKETLTAARSQIPKSQAYSRKKKPLSRN